MPIAKLIDKTGKEIKSIDFKVTGKPLPHSVNDNGVIYHYEQRDGTVYIYKQEA